MQWMLKHSKHNLFSGTFTVSPLTRSLTFLYRQGLLVDPATEAARGVVGGLTVVQLALASFGQVARNSG